MMLAPLVQLLAVGTGCPPHTVPWEDGSCEPIKSATATATDYLRKNIFAFDKANEATFFGGGVAASSVDLALGVRSRFGWAASVPRPLWRQFVLPYASVNEARTDWRQLMWDVFSKQSWLLALSNDTSLGSVALALNEHMWADLRPGGQSPIAFRSEQTPLIFDAMSTIAFGYVRPSATAPASAVAVMTS